MAASSQCFVEWKEQYISKEPGNRVVHYFLKDISGESILAVVGTERSVRHMFYVVSDEFLKVHGAEYSGIRWRSRREVVNWLTSMLSKQHLQSDRSNSAKNDLIPGVGAQENHMPEYKGRLARSLKGHASDIVWSGVAWTCGKQLKHYLAFCRNGIKIGIHSFVFVMAEEESHYLAYLEDMYEDRKGQKKVKVRWFHRNREVKGVISLRNPHPKEVFITPYAQVISAECVDGPAIVLTREHYEKCIPVFPDDVLARVHLCFRQFKNNRVKPFKLSKLRGYFDQQIFSCFGPDFFEDEELSPGDNVKSGGKRTRSCRERQMTSDELSYQSLRYGLLSGRLISRKHVERRLLHTPIFKVNEKIELLCQDSGIRGCWFRCTVLQVSHRQIKVQYDDVKDEEGCGNLEEWIPAFKLAVPDKLGMRYSGRPTIRPASPRDETNTAFEIGDPVDAWWSDGWWEGVVTGVGNSESGSHQVYIPSEKLFLNVAGKNLRVSRDWVGGKWVDIDANPDISSAISAATSPDAKPSLSSPITKEAKSDGFPNSSVEVPTNNPSIVETGLAPSVGLPEDMNCVNEEKSHLKKDDDKENSGKNVDDCREKDAAAYVNDHGDDFHDNDVVKELETNEFEAPGRKCEAEPMEVAA